MPKGYNGDEEVNNNLTGWLSDSSISSDCYKYIITSARFNHSNGLFIIMYFFIMAIPLKYN